MAGQQSRTPSRTPGWLWALGALALTAIGASMLFAVAIGIVNFARIGV